MMILVKLPNLPNVTDDGIPQVAIQVNGEVVGPDGTGRIGFIDIKYARLWQESVKLRKFDRIFDLSDRQ